MSKKKKQNDDFLAQEAKEIERNAIEESIKNHKGNMSRCAKCLGISRPTLYRKLEHYHIFYEEK